MATGTPSPASERTWTSLLEPAGPLRVGAGPGLQSEVLDMPMPEPPGGCANTKAVEAITNFLRPGETILDLFEVRYGVYPNHACQRVTCYEWLLNATKPRDPSGVLAITSDDRIIRWVAESYGDCYFGYSSATLESYPLAELSHAQLLRYNRNLSCRENFALCTGERLRAPRAAVLNLSFGSVTSSGEAGTLASYITELPRPVDAKFAVDLSTASSVFSKDHTEAQRQLGIIWWTISLIKMVLFDVLELVKVLVKSLFLVLKSAVTATVRANIVGSSGSNVLSIMSNELELIHNKSRAKGTSPRSTRDAGFDFLTKLKHLIMTRKVDMMHHSLGRSKPVSPLSIPGEEGFGWKVLAEGEQRPLLVPSKPSSILREAMRLGGAIESVEAASTAAVANPLAVAERRASEAFPDYGSPAGRKALALAKTGSLEVSIDTRLVPFLPGERVLATLPSRRTLSTLDLIGMALVGLAAILCLADGISLFTAGSNTFVGPDLSIVAAIVACCALGFIVAGAGGNSGVEAMQIPSARLTALFLVAIAVNVIIANIEPLNHDLRGAFGIVAAVCGVLSIFGVFSSIMNMLKSMGSVILTSHRIISVAIRSLEHSKNGDLDDDKEMAMVVDSWVLAAGIQDGYIARGKLSMAGEFRVDPTPRMGALHVTPYIEEMNPFAACYRGLSRTNKLRMNYFWDALLNLSPPKIAVEPHQLPPLPEGRLMSPPDIDPFFRKDGYDGKGVAGRLSLVSGEQVLAYYDTVQAPDQFITILVRFLSCGITPEEEHFRLVVTNRRTFALAWAQNHPKCFSSFFYVRRDLLVFGPAVKSAKNFEVTTRTYLDKCACFRWPWQPDPSQADVVMRTVVGSLDLHMSSSTGLARVGPVHGMDGHWAGLAGDPLLIHLQRILAALALGYNNEYREKRAKAPAVLTDPSSRTSIGLGEVFPAPDRASRRPRVLYRLQDQWAELRGARPEWAAAAASAGGGGTPVRTSSFPAVARPAEPASDKEAMIDADSIKL
jgi:hypothetical protein